MASFEYSASLRYHRDFHIEPRSCRWSGSWRRDAPRHTTPGHGCSRSRAPAPADPRSTIPHAPAGQDVLDEEASWGRQRRATPSRAPYARDELPLLRDSAPAPSGETEVSGDRVVGRVQIYLCLHGREPSMTPTHFDMTVDDFVHACGLVRHLGTPGHFWLPR